MATLKEYHDRYFGHTMSHSDQITLATRDGALQATTVEVNVRYDFKACVKYLSVFIEGDAYSRRLVEAILLQIDPVFQNANGVRISGGNTSDGVFTHPDDRTMNDFPFSGKIFLYVDSTVDDTEGKELVEAAHSLGLKLEIIDARFAASQSAAEVPLAFISHDSRDKDSVARDLAMNLSRMACPVWYDEFQLRAGDSLRASIDHGLATCEKCVVILSPNFCDGTGWTGAEFNAAFGQHVEKGDVIIPVWHDISREEVAAFSPMIADLYAVKSGGDPEDMARAVYRSIMGVPR